MPTIIAPDVFRRCAQQVQCLYGEALDSERAHAAQLAAVRSEHRRSAANLLHYLAVRRHDVRLLQQQLAELGLSSLGRMEAHALASLDALLAVLKHLSAEPLVRLDHDGLAGTLSVQDGRNLLEQRTWELLGRVSGQRPVRIMVTMPSEAATDPHLIRRLLEAGMDVMRINAAHDDAAVWAAMVAKLREAEAATGRRCRVHLDLGGPKLRTGRIAARPGVLRFGPRYDERGVMLKPARVLLTAGGEAATTLRDIDAVAPVSEAFAAAARVGDTVHFQDMRGRTRWLTVTTTDGRSVVAEGSRGSFVTEGTALELRRGSAAVMSCDIGRLPPAPQALRLSVGDELLLCADIEEGQPAVRDASGAVIEPAVIGCTLPRMFEDVQAGHRVFFDDGKLGGVVRSVLPGRVRVEITHAARGSVALHADKGINLPDTELKLPALTPKDIADLSFALTHADSVGLSFVRRPEDVTELLRLLSKHGGEHLGIVLKIETRQAFEHLPRILLAGLAHPRLGVMVARGDLGVELGFERLAEVQEEILWICEAAHVPVIWATQVLDTMARKGMPSRAEVTDAAMAGRAECVMLNKGPHMVEVLRFLCDVLHRMQEHQQKKRSLLRPLHISENV